MPSGVYPRGPSRARVKTTRTLRPGEPRPDWEPYRYPDRAGYVRLRWLVGPGEYVEVREHRAIAAVDDRHVHHKDHNPANNDPANLELLTPLEHARLHGREREKFDRPMAAELYRAGWSTTEVAAYFHVTAGVVSRGLRAFGVEMRPRSRRLIEVDVAEILRLHSEGRPAAWIGRHIGSTREVVAARIRSAGLKLGPTGRPENRRVA